MIGRKIAGLGMEIVVRYGKEGKAEGLDSEVRVAAPKTDSLAFLNSDFVSTVYYSALAAIFLLGECTCQVLMFLIFCWVL